MSKLLYQTTFDNICNFNLDDDTRLILIKECVEAGVNTDQKINTYLRFMMFRNQHDTINYLLSVVNIEKIRFETFSEACYKNDLKTVEMLLDMGMNPNDRYDDLISIEMLKLLMRYGFDPHDDWNNLFNSACYKGDIELVKYLISIGVDCNAFIYKPIMRAIYPNNRLEIIKLLIDYGADTEGLLEHAFNYEKFDVCKLLLEHNVNIVGCIFKSNSNKEIIEKFIELFAEYGHDIRDLINK